MSSPAVAASLTQRIGYVMGVGAEPGEGSGVMMKSRFLPLSGKFGIHLYTTLSGEYRSRRFH